MKKIIYWFINSSRLLISNVKTHQGKTKTNEKYTFKKTVSICEVKYHWSSYCRGLCWLVRQKLNPWYTNTVSSRQNYISIIPDSHRVKMCAVKWIFGCIVKLDIVKLVRICKWLISRTFRLGVVLNKETLALAIKMTAKFENIEILKWKETQQI